MTTATATTIEFSGTNAVDVAFRHGGETVCFATIKRGRNEYWIQIPDRFAQSTADECCPTKEAAMDRAAELAREWIAGRALDSDAVTAALKASAALREWAGNYEEGSFDTEEGLMIEGAEALDALTEENRMLRTKRG